MDADDQAFAAEAALDHFTRARLGELPRGASDLPIAAVHIADETMQAIQTAIESGEIKQLAELSLHTAVRPGVEGGPPRTSIEVSRWPEVPSLPEWEPASGLPRPRGPHIVRTRSLRQTLTFLKELDTDRRRLGDSAIEIHAHKLRNVLG
jgi:hypothetical protein